MQLRGGLSIALALLSLIPFAATAAGATKLLVPAYFGAYNPDGCSSGGVTGAWKEMADGGRNIIAIINPNSGPLYTATDATIKCLPHMRKAKVTAIGYVATGYGKRPMADIQRDITRYRQKYAASGLPGLFLDEGTAWWDTSRTLVARYAEIARFARASGFKYLVLNAGTRFHPQLLDSFNLIVGYESAGSQWRVANQHGVCPRPYFTKGGDPEYCSGTQTCDINSSNCRQAKQDQVAAIVFCQPRSRQILAEAQKAGYGAVYITDQGCNNSNPYERIASYFEATRKKLPRA